jgi:hypothetical protein
MLLGTFLIPNKVFASCYCTCVNGQEGQMFSAIIGFVGVIVGAVIVSGSNYLIASSHERAVTKRENDNRAIEVKRGSRLIDADLSRAQAAGNICVKQKHWWSADVSPLTVEGWQQYRGIIAPVLSYNAWVAVRDAVEAVDNLKTARSIGIEAGQTTIPDSTVEQIVPMLNDINDGRAALATFVNDQPTQT